jgi:hypothetical protein
MATLSMDPQHLIRESLEAHPSGSATCRRAGPGC